MHETSLIAYKSGTYSFVFKMERESSFMKLRFERQRPNLVWEEQLGLNQNKQHEGKGRLGVPIMGMDLKSVAMVLLIPTTSFCSALSFSEVGKAYRTFKIWVC